jgi:hypothetical protein
MKRGSMTFDTSSKAEDADAQIAIKKWFVFSTLKGAFGGSSDTTLSRLRLLLKASGPQAPFPAQDLYKSLGIEPQFSLLEIEQILGYSYQGKYTNLVLSLLYPNRDWKDAEHHEDHIFPKSEFQVQLLKDRGYSDEKVAVYMDQFNTLPNLELLTGPENLSKNATRFDDWISSRDPDFRKRHLIPELNDYGFDHFAEFATARGALIAAVLRGL